MTRPRRDSDDWGPMYLGIGTAHNVAEAEADPVPSSTPVLWLPDAPRGFSGHVVSTPRPAQAPRPIGFRRVRS